jgi:beta-N-acetylhexosaminidase
MRYIFVLFFSFLSFLSGVSGQRYSFQQNKWTDSVYATMTTEEKIGQLMMVAGYSHPDQYNQTELKRLVLQHKVGGVIFFKGSPQRQAAMFNELQLLSRIPLWVGIDGEWGLNMRLDSTVKFPRQMAVAAFPDDSIVYEMGREIGRQCRRMGIHINFAPVADINNNPANPVINDRSWGENRDMVSRLSLAYMRGLQDEGVIACIKHFPGHGDTETDSHHDLPLIRFPYSRLDSVELYPFRYLIDSGAMSVMSAHLYVPALDPSPRLASSLSRRIVKELLQDSMGFKGLIFTDALNMKGVTKYHAAGEPEVKALMAGNDVLLFPENIPLAIQKIKAALDSCLIDSNVFEASVKKVLAAKYFTAQGEHFYIDTADLIKDLNPPSALELLDEISQNQITVVKRNKKTLPLDTRDKKVACIAIGDNVWNTFHKSMSNYGRYDFFGIMRDASAVEFDMLSHYLEQEKYDVVVISLHNTNRLKSRMYGLTNSGVALVGAAGKYSGEVVLVSFGIPYNLQYFENIPNVVVAYQDIDLNMEKAAQALHGAVAWKGRLSVGVDNSWKYMQGIVQEPAAERLVYTVPEKAGMDSRVLERIDSVVHSGIEKGAFPGCQVLVARKGKVIYQKAFGYHTYEKAVPVQNSDIYDLASVTKIAATTLAVMLLEEKGKIDLDRKASHYLKDLRKSNKADIVLRDLLTHTSGLKSWIPFYKKTLDSSVYGLYYSEKFSDEYPVQVAENLFAHAAMKDSVWQWIKVSDLGVKGKYVYSDLGFFILQRIVETVSGSGLDEYLEKNIYAPLQLANLGFLPRSRFSHDRLTPTEADLQFRRQLITGHVHDPAAALLGGVGGNAGLFGNANDLAVLMQLLLNKGTYNGVRIFEEETVNRFTTYADIKSSRRGLGFDKPEPDQLKPSPCSPCASPFSFGHSGFTGTFTWADPRYDLVYVFLSNRVFPDAENTKISRWNIRTDIQDIIYRSFFEEPCIK